MDRTGRDSMSKSGTICGTGQYQILTACLLPWDKTGQSRKRCSIAGKWRSKTEKDVLQQERMFKTEKWHSKTDKLVIFSEIYLIAISWIEIHFVLGQRSLSLDFCSCPCQKDPRTNKFHCPRTKGKQHIPSLGNASLNTPQDRALGLTAMTPFISECFNKIHSLQCCLQCL